MGSPGLQEPGLFVYFERMKLRSYLFTVRYRSLWDSEWEHKNILIEHQIDLKSALKAMRDKFAQKITIKIVVDNVYSEEEQV